MGAQTFFPPDEQRGAAAGRRGKGVARKWLVAIVGVGLAVGVFIGWLGAAVLVGPGGQPTGPTTTSPGAVVLVSTAAPTATPLPTPTPTPTPIPIVGGSWPAYLGGPTRTGFSASETQLTAQTVGSLKRKWTAHAGGSVFSQPVVVNGLVYWGSWDGYEHATDIASGHDVWATYLGRTVDDDCNPSTVGVTSTAAIASTTIKGVPTLVAYVGGGDGTLYALNATTGSIIWRARFGSSPSHFLWSSPAAYDGSVFMGVSSFGDCPLIQGEVVRLDGATGAVQHVFKVVPDGCVGGSVWGSITLDPATGELFFGTGNPAECAKSEPYAEAFVALRIADLSPLGRWVVPLAEQVGDGDFGSTPTLFSATINGQTRAMVGIGNKSGMYYAFDEANVNAGPVWRTRLADPGHCPQCGSGILTPGAWDGVTLYALAGATSLNGTACVATVRALDPATGHTRWAYCINSGAALGALTLGPGFAIASGGGTMFVIGTQGGQAGKALFRFTDPNDPGAWFYGPAAISNGMVYVGNADGNLFAFGL